MYDKMLVLENLENIESTLLRILDRTSDIKVVDDFTLTPQGVDLLDATTIRLMAVGEEINKIDKRTKGTLLGHYPEIEWNDIIAFRNFVAHTYFKIDAEIIFLAVQNKVPQLLSTIQKIIANLKNKT
jgi:uncharacterized protein with HEPN domain